MSRMFNEKGFDELVFFARSLALSLFLSTSKSATGYKRSFAFTRHFGFELNVKVFYISACIHSHTIWYIIWIYEYMYIYIFTPAHTPTNLFT